MKADYIAYLLMRAFTDGWKAAGKTEDEEYDKAYAKSWTRKTSLKLEEAFSEIEFKKGMP